MQSKVGVLWVLLFSLNVFADDRAAEIAKMSESDLRLYCVEAGSVGYAERARVCFELMKRQNEKTDIEDIYRIFDISRKGAGLTLHDFNIGPVGIEQMREVGHASRACEIWDALDHADVMTVLIASKDIFEDARNLFNDDAKAAKGYHRCIHAENEWNLVKKKIDALSMIPEACEALGSAKRSERILDREKFVKTYVRLIEKIEKKEMLNQLPSSCKATEKTILEIRSSPYLSVLADLADKIKAIQEIKSQLSSELLAHQLEAVAVLKIYEDEKDSVAMQKLRKAAERFGGSESNWAY